MPPYATDPCASDELLCNTTWTITQDASWSRAADLVLGTPLAIAGLVVLALMIRFLLHRVVDRIVRRAETGVLPNRLSRTTVGAGFAREETLGSTRRVQRAQTMGSLLKNIISGVTVAVFGTMILSEVGLDIAPLIASAGIIGVALGFGAQSLVKDFLSGIFMIFEDQYGVGDSIDLATVSGTVEAVSLRVTHLRDVNGTVWYVRNGEILRVGNQSQNWARTVLDVPVAPDADLVQVRRVLQEVAHDLWIDDDFRGTVLEEPEVWGVQALAHDSITLRLTLKTAPLAQWRVAREMRERVKSRFDHEGIVLGPVSE
ncbi:MAG: mechanosensitive ion channel family protein [Nocardioides sp.]